VILLCDESVDGPIVLALRRDGIEVLYVAEMEPGLPDDEVLDRANARGAILADYGYVATWGRSPS
jgi:hypothetical protein